MKNMATRFSSENSLPEKELSSVKGSELERKVLKESCLPVKGQQGLEQTKSFGIEQMFPGGLE